MDKVFGAFGSTMTTFLKGMSGLFDWLVTPLKFFGQEITIPWTEFSVTPLALFGAGFVIIIGYVILRSLTI